MAALHRVRDHVPDSFTEGPIELFRRGGSHIAQIKSVRILKRGRDVASCCRGEGPAPSCLTEGIVRSS
jgi:hypothetical protein